MSTESSSTSRDGFCIYVDTFYHGPLPVVSDENGYIIFNTDLEAQREIVDKLMTRLQHSSSTASANTRMSSQLRNASLP